MRVGVSGAIVFATLPRSVEEVAQILRICNREEVAVVPQGGNTSYCGGATPDDSGRQVVMALARMNRIRSVDPANDSLIAVPLPAEVFSNAGISSS